MAARDLIGKRGESIVMTRLLDFCGNPVPYFDPHPLGEKCPTYDYLVELVNATESAPYFFVQVKATKKPLTAKRRRLAVQVSVEDVQRMVECPVPTYLVGVDEPAGEAYIVSVHGSLSGAIGSMPAKFPLNPANLKQLWDEVKQYWERLDPKVRSSAFTFWEAPNAEQNRKARTTDREASIGACRAAPYATKRPGRA